MNQQKVDRITDLNWFDESSLKTVVEEDKPYEGARYGDYYIEFQWLLQNGNKTTTYLPITDMYELTAQSKFDRLKKVLIDNKNLISNIAWERIEKVIEDK